MPAGLARALTRSARPSATCKRLCTNGWAVSGCGCLPASRLLSVDAEVIRLQVMTRYQADELVKHCLSDILEISGATRIEFEFAIKADPFNAWAPDLGAAPATHPVRPLPHRDRAGRHLLRPLGRRAARRRLARPADPRPLLACLFDLRAGRS